MRKLHLIPSSRLRAAFYFNISDEVRFFKVVMTSELNASKSGFFVPIFFKSEWFAFRASIYLI
jgi:hypothetical protein